MNADFVNDVACNQNNYEIDSVEYASDFTSNEAEQRIDYLYMRNNQVYLTDLNFHFYFAMKKRMYIPTKC